MSTEKNNNLVTKPPLMGNKNSLIKMFSNSNVLIFFKNQHSKPCKSAFIT